MNDLDFVPVKEDLPPLDKSYRNLSREVEVMLEDGNIVVAYYDYIKDNFRLVENNKQIKQKALAWRDL